ncbi:MAG: aspartate aminotransferase family protein [Chloroflexi bacterium]|nr:aspartate aminotransferase family protein [Chloroflexota bacterium]
MAISPKVKPDKALLQQLGKDNLWLGFGRDSSFFDRDASIMVSGNGCWVTDVDGNRYLDSSACLGAAILGYSHPRIIKALVDQAQIMCSNASGQPASIPTILLAHKVATLGLGEKAKLFYSLSGSGAVDTALKMARQYFKITGKASKYKTITRWGAYHGATLSGTAASGIPSRRRAFEPLSDGFIHIEPPYCYRCPWALTYPQCGIECANEFRRTVEREDPDTIACYLGELTMGAGGIIPPPPEYPRMVRQICNEHNILMIVDEVITGFGRTGTWFEWQQCGIVPDMVTTAKAITGGFVPVSAVQVRPEIADVFKGPNVFMHGYTLGSYPLGSAVGLAVIEEMEQTNLLAEVNRKSEVMMSELQRIMDSSPVVGDVRGKGLALTIELVKDRKTKAEFPDLDAVRKLVGSVGRKNGVLLAMSAYKGSFMFLTPLIINEEEIGILMKAVSAAVKEVEAKCG